MFVKMAGNHDFSEQAKRANVLDARGRPLSPCDTAKAARLVQQGRARLVSRQPFTIQLDYVVERIPQAQPQEHSAPDYGGAPLLLHICCAPCATYTVERFREENWHVESVWYNPNIHPFGEHELRRESLERYAKDIALPVYWLSDYEMPEFLRRVAGHERFGERCLICYRMRLERTAALAEEEGFTAISTTLLISPYQDQDALRRIGEEVAVAHGLTFFFENLRRGFSRHFELAREADLYMQRFCGCVYSEWEAHNSDAWTNPRRRG